MDHHRIGSQKIIHRGLSVSSQRLWIQRYQGDVIIYNSQNRNSWLGTKTKIISGHFMLQVIKKHSQPLTMLKDPATNCEEFAATAPCLFGFTLLEVFIWSSKMWICWEWYSLVVLKAFYSMHDFCFIAIWHFLGWYGRLGLIFRSRRLMPPVWSQYFSMFFPGFSGNHHPFPPISHYIAKNDILYHDASVQT